MSEISTGMVVFFQEVKLLTDLGQCPLDKTSIS